MPGFYNATLEPQTEETTEPTESQRTPNNTSEDRSKPVTQSFSETVTNSEGKEVKRKITISVIPAFS